MRGDLNAMKCPFRVVTNEHILDNGEKNTIQEFAECLGEECAAARLVEYFCGEDHEVKVEGCKRLINTDCL